MTATNYLIGAIGVLLIVRYYRQAVLLLPVWALLTPRALLLVDIWSIPPISYYRLFCMVLIGLHVVSLFQAQPQTVRREFPLKFAYFAVVASALISVVLAFLTPNAGAQVFLSLILEVIGPTWIYYRHLARTGMDELHKLLRIYAIALLALLVYAIATYLVAFNPFIDWASSTNQTLRVIARSYEGTIRGLRAQGTITHPLTFGGIAVLYFWMLLTIGTIRRNGPILDRTMMLSLFFLTIVAVILTNSRTPVVFFGVLMVLWMLATGARNAVLSLAAMAIVIPAVLLTSDVLVERILAVINIFLPNVGPEQYGSTIEMRSRQFAVAFHYFEQAPIFGGGLELTRNLIETGAEEALFNAESFIMVLMIDQGAFGALAYAILIGNIVYVAARRAPDGRSFRVVLAGIAGYLVFVLATGLVDTLQYFLFAVLFMLRWFAALKASTAPAPMAVAARPRARAFVAT